MRTAEYSLLATFLLGHLVLLVSQWGLPVGWDSGAHLDMLEQWPWDPSVWSVRSQFYAYHPPVVFALTRLFVVIGFSTVQSAQLFSWLMSLVGFFFVRTLLQSLNLLRTRWGVVFLYVTWSLPVQMYASYSVNMDVAILAISTAVLYFSFHLSQTYWSHISLAAVLCTGLLMKFSALPLLLVPLVVCMLRNQNTRMLRMSMLTVLISLVVVIPYYGVRYIQQEGKLFVSNQDFQEFGAADLARERREVRDRDRIAFVRDFFRVDRTELLTLHKRDQSRIRLVNTWRDLWAGSEHNVSRSHFSLALSHFYSLFALPLLALGLVACMRDRRHATVSQIGMTLLTMSALYFALMLFYTWKYPHPLGIPNKLIYAAPMVLGIGYVLSRAIVSVFAIAAKRHARTASCVGCILLMLFVLVNHFAPVY